jgi:hypothetical protein
MRLAILTVLALAIALAPTASAAEPPDTGCGGDTVEVCAPVCIQGPCYPYACVHLDAGDFCVRP